MTARIAILLFLFSSAALAEYRYIVPAFTTGKAGLDRTFHSTVSFANPGTLRATARIRTYQFAGQPPCHFNDVEVYPRTSTDLWSANRDRECPEQIMALEITSNRPLVVSSHVRSFGLSDSNFADRQEIPIVTDWLPADRDAWIPSFRHDGASSLRSSLFLINPNTFPIEVNIRIERDSGVETVEGTGRLEPDSLDIIPVPGIAIDAVCNISPCQPGHQAFLRATGPFYAGVSTVERYEGAAFFSAVLLNDDDSEATGSGGWAVRGTGGGSGDTALPPLRR
jgi:hypothetical protein